MNGGVNGILSPAIDSSVDLRRVDRLSLDGARRDAGVARLHQYPHLAGASRDGDCRDRGHGRKLTTSLGQFPSVALCSMALRMQFSLGCHPHPYLTVAAHLLPAYSGNALKSIAQRVNDLHSQKR